MHIQISITYHMCSVHPGCGKPAKGKCYCIGDGRQMDII